MGVSKKTFLALLITQLLGAADLPVYHMVTLSEHSFEESLGISPETMPRTVEGIIAAERAIVVVNSLLAAHSRDHGLLQPAVHSYALIAPSQKIMGVISIPDKLLHDAAVEDMPSLFTTLGIKPVIKDVLTDEPQPYLIALTAENFDTLFASGSITLFPFADIIQTLFESKSTHVWNVMHIGHGAPAQVDSSDATKSTVTYVGGMPAYELAALLNQFNSLDVRLVSVISCFCGSESRFCRSDETRNWLIRALKTPRSFTFVMPGSHCGSVWLKDDLRTVENTREFLARCATWITAQTHTADLPIIKTQAERIAALFVREDQKPEIKQLQEIFKIITDNFIQVLRPGSSTFISCAPPALGARPHKGW